MKRVIITGATGMIGLALIECCLAHNCNVAAVVRPGSANVQRLPKDSRLQILEYDLDQLGQLTLETIGRCDVFYHLGWTNTDRNGRLDPVLQEKNILYTLEAVHAAKRLGCSRFVGAGSQAEYGIHTACPTTPESPAAPQIAYGICKFAAGSLGRMEADRMGIDFSWVRIFSVYGPNDLPGTMISCTLKKMLAGERCTFSPGTHLWDYLYSGDAGEALYFIGQRCTGSQVYCLGNGNAFPLKTYIEQMKEITHTNSEVLLGEIPYSNGKGMDLCADISSLQRDTGWNPTTTFEEGIQKILQTWSAK